MASGKKKKIFKNDEFSAYDWSAPVLRDPQKIIERIESFGLVGRNIKHMRLIGMSYDHRREQIEEAVYSQLKDLPESARQIKSEYAAIDPDTLLYRYAYVDEPLLIEFHDGDVFEIDTPFISEYQMGMNTIPTWIFTGTGLPNVEADILFSPCIGQQIVDVKYITGRVDPFTGSYDENGVDAVETIELHLRNGMRIDIGPMIDYCMIECIGSDGECAKIKFAELELALFNWEDIHCDETIGFTDESGALYFGKKGKEHIDTPNMIFVPTDNENSRLYITPYDFLVMDFCISLSRGEWFDEYEDYSFTKSEWYALLDEADRLLSVSSFDELFDELTCHPIMGKKMLDRLNYIGADFWRKKEKSKRMVDSLRKWSDLVIKDGGMNIHGF